MSLFLLSIILAIVWMAVNGSFSATQLVVGLVLSHVALWLTSPLYEGRSYFKKLRKAVFLILFLLKEIVISSVRVARDVLRLNSRARPGVIGIPLDAETDLEITLFADMITLTPGTLSLDVSPDRKTLYVHAMFVDDPDALRAETKAAFERRILEITRP